MKCWLGEWGGVGAVKKGVSLIAFLQSKWIQVVELFWGHNPENQDSLGLRWVSSQIKLPPPPSGRFRVAVTVQGFLDVLVCASSTLPALFLDVVACASSLCVHHRLCPLGSACLFPLLHSLSLRVKLMQPFYLYPRKRKK